MSSNGTVQQIVMNNYSNQLKQRFYGNSIALEVLVCLFMIFLLVIEIIKIYKKTYEWTDQQESQIDKGKIIFNESNSMLRQSNSQMGADNAQDAKIDKTNQAIKREAASKKELKKPLIMKLESILKSRLPQMVVIGSNVVMIASYEYVTITGYIAVVLIVIAEVLGYRNTDHLNLRFVLDLLGKILILSWYVNMFTVGKPGIVKS